jgi:hypothetical protein
MFALDPATGAIVVADAQALAKDLQPVTRTVTVLATSSDGGTNTLSFDIASVPAPVVVEPTPPVVDPTPPVVDPTPPVVDPTPPVVDPTPPVASDPQPDEPQPVGIRRDEWGDATLQEAQDVDTDAAYAYRPVEEQTPLPTHAAFAFTGHSHELAISPFVVPEEGTRAFKSLAQGEFAEEADSPLRESIHFLATTFHNLLTQPGDRAFQVAVRADSEASLRVFRGIPDQEFLQQRDIQVQVPVDAFIHTDEYAVVYLAARMVDGSPLPQWLHFDAATGKFDGKAPTGAPAELKVMVEARDADGRHAEAIFRIRLQKAAVGRAGLSQQIRLVQQESTDALRSLHAIGAGRLRGGARP